MIYIKSLKLSKKSILISIIAVVFIGLSIWLYIELFPFLISLKSEENLLTFKQYIDGLGFKGFLLFLLIQVIQVFVAIIPGEIVELLAGLLYGTWGGLIVCLFGNLIGSFLIYCVVKLFAKSYLEKYKEKLSRYSFLNNKKRVILYVFIIFLIPGIPKDIITYLIPFLPISFLQFISVTSIARIPSIITSTYSSDAILNQNYAMAIIVLSVFSILAIIGFMCKDKILEFLRKDSDKKEN